jgi:hypothetical protein
MNVFLGISLFFVCVFIGIFFIDSFIYTVGIIKNIIYCKRRIREIEELKEVPIASTIKKPDVRMMSTYNNSIIIGGKGL